MLQSAARGSHFARPVLVLNVEDAVAYFVVFAQQALQWSTSFSRPNFHCRGFFPLRNEVLCLLIQINVWTKRYREQWSILLYLCYPTLFSDRPTFCVHV